MPFLAGLPEHLDFVLALHEGSAVAMAAGHAIARGARRWRSRVLNPRR